MKKTSTLALPSGGRSLLLLASLAPLAAFAHAQPSACRISEAPGGARVVADSGTVELQVIDANILRVDAEPGGKISPRTLVIDPALKAAGNPQIQVSASGESVEIRTPQVQITFACSPRFQIAVHDRAGVRLVAQQDLLGQARGRRAAFLHASGENLYGMSGLSRRENGGGLTRNNGAEISAGAQGEAGAPWFFTTRYGVLIDSNGGAFDTRDGGLPALLNRVKS
jgi:hypothetical protein